MFVAAGADIGAVFAAFAAIADDGTVGADAAVCTPSAVVISAVFADLAAFDAEQNIFTVGTGFAAAVAEGRAVVAAFQAVTDDGTAAAGIAVVAEFVVADTGGASAAGFTDPVGTFQAVGAAAFADIFAVFTAAFAVFADLNAALAQAAVFAEELQTVGAVFAAILADLFGSTFAAEAAAAVADVVALFAAAAASVITFTALVVDAHAAVLADDGTFAAALIAVFTDDGAAVAQLAGVAPVISAILAVFFAIGADFIVGTFAALFPAANAELVALFTAVVAFVVAVAAVFQAVAAFVTLLVFVVQTLAAIGAVPLFVAVGAVAVFRAVVAAVTDPVFGDPAAAVFTIEILFPGGPGLQRQTARPGHFHGGMEVICRWVFRAVVMAVRAVDMDPRNTVEQHEQRQQDTEQFAGGFHRRFLLCERILTLRQRSMVAS